MRLRTLALSLVAAAGCGSVTKLTDANNGDSGPADANNQPGIVKVTVMDPTGANTPAPGVQVVFINPDGSLAARMPTDTNGKTQATVMPGASVTAVWPASQNTTELETVLAVRPGDDILLTFFSVPQDNTNIGTFTINMTAPVGQGFTYYAYGPCGGSSSSAPAVQLTFFNYCKPSGPMEIVGEVHDSTGAVVGTVDATNVTFSSGSSFTMPSQWQSPQNFNASFSDITTDVASLSISRTSPPSYGTQSGTSGTTSGTTLLLSMMAPPAGSSAEIETVAGASTGSRQQIYQRVNGNVFNYGLDVGANLVPWLGQTTLDPSTATVTVPVQGSEPIDAFGVVTSYSRTVNTTTTTFEWLVWGPTAGNVTLPTMPLEVGDVNPKATDTAAFFQVAIAAASDQYAGYDSIRNDPYGALNAIFAGALPGTSVLSYAPQRGKAITGQ